MNVLKAFGQTDRQTDRQMDRQTDRQIVLRERWLLSIDHIEASPTFNL